MTELPICVIDAGSIGMRHIGCAVASDKLRLTAVVEADTERCAALVAEGLPAVLRLDAVPPDTRAAIIATPTPDHALSALACLERGWVVLVEKPMTATLAEAEALTARAATLGLPLRVGHHRRCHPFVTEARVRLRHLGALVLVQGIWSLRKHDTYYDPPWRRQAGAGPILTNLSHEIDLLQFFAGPITEVAAMTANAARGFTIEDTTALSLRFASGALGSFVLSDAGASPWAFEASTGENPAIAPRGGDPLRFVGTRGALSFPSLDTWAVTGDTPADWQHPLTRTAGPDLPKVDGIAEQLHRFAAIAQGAGDDLLATGAEACMTMAVLDAVRLAADTGKTRKVAA